ncbi:hypothetical protein [Kitasatospora aureofaciens]|uniref:hypothetical protein n=1 Tax=Kitasatospora aureofaciens TaxID=1894 RepID=UPI0037C736F4
MITGSILAAPTPTGFIGCAVDTLGQPGARVPLLLDLIRNQHHGDAAAVTARYVHDHPAGWLMLPDRGLPGACYCHTHHRSMNRTFTERTADARHPWVYVLNATHLTVLRNRGNGTFNNAGDFLWADEPAADPGAPLRAWRAVYYPLHDCALPNILAIEPDPDDGDAELIVACLQSITVDAATAADALLLAHAAIARTADQADH